ncbi:MAG: hypothetical protein QM689_12385 [Oscillospiraceae bacterium]
MGNNYEDIIKLPRHISATRQRMSLRDRAAQFSPFAALAGYDAEVKETARLTDEKLALNEYKAAQIDTCLQMLIDNAAERPTVSITFFKPDEKKSGGAYVTVSDHFRRIDESDYTVVLTSGMKIPIADIYAMDGDIFRLLDQTSNVIGDKKV